VLDFSKQHVAPSSKRGLFTIEQYLVLKYRARGYTQLETAKALSMSRANVSMIESRARTKLKKARVTVRAYYSFKSMGSVVVERGTRLQDVPRVVLDEADRVGIHLRSNIVDILRMTKSKMGPNCVRKGRITKDLRFDFNPEGRLYISSRS
jgi:Tfx family DNA-binding protein